MNIQNNAMLCTLSTGMVGINKTDKDISSEIASAKSTTVESLKAIKSLFTKKDLSMIKMYQTQARTIHNKYTLPWSDSGQRLLPCSVYPRYSKEMSDTIARFDYAVNCFLDDYEKTIEQAQARLGDAFNHADYPSQEQVKSRFRIVSKVQPMPKSDDFRTMELSDADIQAVKKSYEIELSEKVADAVDSLVRSLYDAVKHMQTSLVEGKSFHESSFTKLKDILALAPKLNITNDPDITALIDRLELECNIHSFNVKDAREHIGYRNKMTTNYTNAVNDILENFMGGVA